VRGAGPGRGDDRRAPEVATDLVKATEELVSSVVLPNVAERDRDDVLPDAVFDHLIGLGIPGALVPEQDGGPGLGVGEMAPVWRALSRGWISLTGAVSPTGLATTLLVRHGTEAQRAFWLPQIARGDVIAAFSITEPQAGSDLKRLECGARPDRRRRPRPRRAPDARRAGRRGGRGGDRREDRRSDTAVWAVDRAARLAASRSYTADAELARLRRDAPQTQIGEGANDALLIALGRRGLAELR
jgi:alkylation response protein AidB-like acyl-CoA dehydrogenase